MTFVEQVAVEQSLLVETNNLTNTENVHISNNDPQDVDTGELMTFQPGISDDWILNFVEKVTGSLHVGQSIVTPDIFPVDDVDTGEHIIIPVVSNFSKYFDH